MFSTGDFKISLSSIEFSLFFQEEALFCPSCGCQINSNPINEVRLSSILLLIGVGSLVCYKLVINQNRKKKKRRSFFESLDAEINEENSFEKALNNIPSLSYNRRFNKKAKYFTSTPFNGGNCEYTPSIPTPSSTTDSQFNAFDFTDGYGFDSSASTVLPASIKGIGDTTVAKLDQLLMQIQDIKKSVVEIDNELYEVKGTNIRFNADLFSLTPETTPNFNANYDYNDLKNSIITEPQTPSLEWDQTDIIGHNEFYKNSAQTPPVLKPSSLRIDPLRIDPSINNINNYNTTESNKNPVVSPLDVSSSSSSVSTSGKFSLVSSPEIAINDNAKTIQNMIEEAQHLGLSHDLLEALLKSSKHKRDSAYFED